jgi:hypothetical protein
MFFVYDFLGLAQGTAERRRQITRILLHSIDEVLQPADPSRPLQKEPACKEAMEVGTLVRPCWVGMWIPCDVRSPFPSTERNDCANFSPTSPHNDVSLQKISTRYWASSAAWP